MKKVFLSGLMIAGCTAAMAQPVISSANFDVNEPVTWKAVSGSLAPGASGANVTWDFSGLGSSNANTQIGGNCPGDTACNPFPAANRYVKVQTPYVTYSLMTISASGIEQIGTNNSIAVTRYTDPLTLYKFPMTYNQSYTDRFVYSAANRGTFTSLADGYGTLITPSATYTNTLRRKSVQYDTAIVGTLVSASVITTYSWVKGGVKHPLMTITITELPGQAPQTFTLYSSTLPTAIGTATPLDALITIYPNPAANSNIEINSSHCKVKAIKVADITGKVIYYKNTESGNTGNFLIPLKTFYRRYT